jgi:hypothetical protein
MIPRNRKANTSRTLEFYNRFLLRGLKCLKNADISGNVGTVVAQSV